MNEALEAANELGYPVLLRPSYVIGGQNMKIVHDDAEVTTYMQRILAQGIDNPVLVDKYMMGTELEVDVISDGTDVLIPGIMEHIERAGVHSGDSIAVYPPYNLNDMMTDKIVDSSRKLALALGTKGLVNIQYLIWENELYVIEVNPRASRTVPYISKVTGVPMVDVASRVMLGAPLARATEAPGKGTHWGSEARHQTLPRGYRTTVGTVGPLEQVLFGPSHQADGKTNFIGALKRAMASTGYVDVKNFQRCGMVVNPYSAR